MDDGIAEIGGDGVITMFVPNAIPISRSMVSKASSQLICSQSSPTRRIGYFRRLSSNWMEASAGAFGHILPLLNGSLGSGLMAKLCSPFFDGS